MTKSYYHLLVYKFENNETKEILFESASLTDANTLLSTHQHIVVALDDFLNSKLKEVHLLSKQNFEQKAEEGIPIWGK
jgi:hypothetical protein